MAIARQVQAYRAWPQAFTTWDGKLLKVLRVTPLPAQVKDPPGTAYAGADGSLVVAAGDGQLQLDEVTLEGRKPQPGKDLLRGYPGLVGARLGV